MRPLQAPGPHLPLLTAAALLALAVLLIFIAKPLLGVRR